MFKHILLATDGSDVAQPYIVMERVQVRTLRDIIQEGRKILPERALEITSDVADGPNNLILDQVTNGVPVRMAVLYLLSHPHGEQVP